MTHMTHQVRHKPTTDENVYFSRFYHKQHQVHMIKVLPGGVYCSGSPEIISTGLGSCVAACMWDPDHHVGGMNHFLLPFDNINEERHWHANEIMSTASRYGNHAMEILINQLLNLGARRERLRLKLFGGAQMMGYQSLIGEKNVEFVMSYVEREQLQLDAYDLGGLEPRRIMFDPLNGRAWLKRIPFAEISHLRHEEERYAHELGAQTHQTDESDEAELF